jgi:hypothetical protein
MIPPDIVESVFVNKANGSRPVFKITGCLIKNMVMADESNSEPFYTSGAHDTNDLEQTSNASETSIKVYIKSKKG